MSTMNIPNRTTESGEWIGPRLEHGLSSDVEQDGITPTPKPREDPLESLKRSQDAVKVEEKDKLGIPAGGGGSRNTSQHSFMDTDMIYSWAADNKQADQYYYPSQMSNPFIAPTTKARPPVVPAQALPAKRVSPSAAKPSIAAESPKSIKETTPPRPTLPRQVPDTPPYDDYHEHYSVARIEPLPVALPEQQPSEHGLPPGLSPGIMVPVAPSYSPIPMHHTQSNPLPYPGIPARVDHPTNILHRVGSVLPDITALMDLYYGTCHMLNARDQHVRDIEAQKAAESNRQTQRIDSLTRDIQSMIRHHENEEKNLQGDLQHVERKFKKLQESHARECSRRDDARSAHAGLQELHEKTKRIHREDMENIHKAHTLEKERTMVIHESERRSLLDQLAHIAKAAEEATAAAEQRNVSERQTQEARWQRTVRDLEEKHCQHEAELAHTVKSQREMLEEERGKHANFKDTWSRDREEMTRQWTTEKASLRIEAEEQRRNYLTKHRKSMDDLQRLSDESVERVRAEHDGKISKLQRENADCQHQLEQTIAFHGSEIQSASETFRKEKEDFTKAMETSSQQRINELQATIRTLQKGERPHASSRDPSESRRLLEAQSTVMQLQKQNEGLLRSRGASQSRLNSEAQDIIAKMQKENEALRADRVRVSKSKAEDTAHSRSATPAPKEEKLERTRSNRASGIFTTSGSSRREKVEEGHRHHRLS